MKGYLHIGMPKTATTSIQNTLYCQRDQLLSNSRLLYPGLQANLTTPLCSMFMTEPKRHVANRLIDPRELQALIAGYFATLEGEIQLGGFDTIVLSAEGLVNLNDEEIGRIRQWLHSFCDDWTILCWARHPESWTTSNVQQLLKTGKSFESAPARENLPNYRGRLTNWIRNFGRDAIRLSNFDEIVAAPGGAVGCFAEQIGMDAAAIELLLRAEQRENESMSGECAELLSTLNRLRPMIVEDKLGPQRTGRELQLLMQIPGRRFALDPDVRREIRRLSRDDVAWLNETFGVNYYPDVFEDAPPGEAADPDALQQRWQRDSLDALVLLVSNLINSNFALQRAHAAEAALRQQRFNDAANLFAEAARVNPHNPTYLERAEELRRKHPLAEAE